MKPLLRQIGVLALALGVSAAEAAPTFITSGGQITGINGVDVDGTLYNVTFEDSSFSAIWPSTTPAFWNNATAAFDAASALATLLAGDPDSLGVATDPTVVSGIVGVDSGTGLAFLEIPYFMPCLEGCTTVSTTTAVFDSSIPGWSTLPAATNSYFLTDDLSTFDNAVYANFTVAEAPEPATLGLLAIGLAGLRVRKLRTQAPTASQHA